MIVQFALYPVLVLYLASTFCYMSAFIGGKKRLDRWGYYILLAGFGLHFLALVHRYLVIGYTPITNLNESFSFLALSIAAFFIFLKRTYRIGMLGSVFLPLLSVMIITTLAIPATIRPLPPALQSYWLPVHTVFAFLGDAIFFAGFLVSIVYLIAERNVKKKQRGDLSDRLPSLDTLDRINYKCMAFGFPLLTLGIITGSLWAELAWGSYWNWDPKETWSLITWIVYAILIHNRLTIGWRGRRTAYLMIAGFVSILITFIGVGFFMGGLHSYM